MKVYGFSRMSRPMLTTSGPPGVRSDRTWPTLVTWSTSLSKVISPPTVWMQTGFCAGVAASSCALPAMWKLAPLSRSCPARRPAAPMPELDAAELEEGPPEPATRGAITAVRRSSPCSSHARSRHKCPTAPYPTLPYPALPRPPCDLLRVFSIDLWRPCWFLSCKAPAEDAVVDCWLAVSLAAAREA